MKTIFATTQASITAVGGFLGWYLGGLDGFLYALVAFVVVDYITGVMRAILERKLSSSIGARGIFKKVAIFLIIGVAHLADLYLLHESGVLRMATIFFFISNEGVSLLENAAAIGLPVPEKLKNALAQLRDKGDKAKDDEVGKSD